MVVGENGILNRAQEASKKYKEADAKERIQMEVESSYGINGKIDFEILNQNLKNNLDGILINGKLLSDTNKIDNLPVWITYNGIDIELTGKVIAAKQIKSENYGDKVEYSANGIDDWEIFYNDGNNVFLITTDLIPNEKIPEELYMNKQGIYRTYWTLNTLNMYSNGMEQIKYDVAKKYLLGWKFKNETCKTNGTFGVATLLDIDKWSLFTNKYANSAIGSPTIEMFIKSWNNTYPNEKLYFEDSLSNIGYKISRDKNNYGDHIADTTMQNTSCWKERTENLYYNRLSKFDDSGDCWGYWIASPGADHDHTLFYIDFNGAIWTTDDFTATRFTV